nr:hypothetical protein [Tanacetum cinerariifolium]
MVFDGTLRNLDNVFGKFLMYPKFLQTFLDKQLDGLLTHNEKYDVSFHTKKVFANIKRISKGFSDKETPLFRTMIRPNQVQMGEGSIQPIDTQHTPTLDTPPPKPKRTKKPRQPKRKTTKVSQPSGSTKNAIDEAVHKEGVTVCSQGTSSGDGLRRQDTMGDTSAHTRKRTKTVQQTKIDGLERRVKKLKRLYKVSLTARVISSSDDEALDKEDTSKQGRIDEIDADKNIALVSTHDDELQDEGVEDVGEEEVVKVVTTAKMHIDTVVDAAQVTTIIADVPVSAAKTIVTTAPSITAESTKKNVKPRALKNKSFAKIKELFDKAMKRINNFIDFKTELVEVSTKKDKTETIQESSSNRAGDELDHERSKKQKVEDDKESKELKKCLEIIPNNGDDVTIDATPLSS